MGEFKLFIFIATKDLSSYFVSCSVITGGFFFPLCFLFFSFTAQFELTVLSLFLFTLSSTGFEVTYSISLLLVVWIVSKEEFGKHSEILNALHCIGLTAFSGILTPQWPGL